MTKLYMPTLEVSIKRTFDGKPEGERTWKFNGYGCEIDKLEDAIAYLADASMSLNFAVPSPFKPDQSIGAGSGDGGIRDIDALGRKLK